MAVTVSFREQMQEIVERRHCKNHPLTDAWARGELTKEQLGLWAIEHWHFTHDIYHFMGRIMANCDVQEGRAMEINNVSDEIDPNDPHPRQILNFIDACGLDAEALTHRDPLPTTQALRDWLFLLCDRRTWQEAAAGLHIGMEGQLAYICDRVVPALREHYRFDEASIHFFVTHQTADRVHGGRAYDVVEKYTPEELRPNVLRAVFEGTEKRWLYFDGVYVKYVLNYNLGNQPG